MSVSKLTAIQSFLLKAWNTWLKSDGKETAVSGHVSHTDIHTKNGIVWTAARHRAECQPYTWEKS